MAAAGKHVATCSKELRCFHFLFKKKKKKEKMKKKKDTSKTLEQPREEVTCPQFTLRWGRAMCPSNRISEPLLMPGWALSFPTPLNCFGSQTVLARWPDSLQATAGDGLPRIWQLLTFFKSHSPQRPSLDNSLSTLPQLFLFFSLNKMFISILPLHGSLLPRSSLEH